MKLIFLLLALGLTFINVANSQLAQLVNVASNDPNDVKFYVYMNSANTDEHQELIYKNPESVVNSTYNSTKPLLLGIHDFLQNYTSPESAYVRDGYLLGGFPATYNFVMIDWSKLAAPAQYAKLPSTIVGEDILTIPAYIQAVRNVKVVAKRVQEFLSFLIANGFLSREFDVHPIGLGLGAHVSGLAGAYYIATENATMGRITALSPSLHGFQDAHTAVRLDPTDALFVDVVHTNQGGFGYVGSDDIGHVNFYVNGGGPTQPECIAGGLANLTDVLCAHNLAARYFANSIFLGDEAAEGRHLIKACPQRSTGVLSQLLCDESDQVLFGSRGGHGRRGSYELDLTVNDVVGRDPIKKS